MRELPVSAMAGLKQIPSRHLRVAGLVAAAICGWPLASVQAQSFGLPPLSPSATQPGDALSASPLGGSTGSTGSAQDQISSEPGRTFSVKPRVSINETATNNAFLNNANKQSDLTTEISPGIRITSTGARLKGYLDYSRSSLLHSSSSIPTGSRNALNTQATLEAIERWGYIDFTGTIGQQAISAFGTQSLDNATVNTNRTEVSSYRLSPYVRGRVADRANYELRLVRSITQTSTALASNSAGNEMLARFEGNSALRSVRWALDATAQRFDYSSGRNTEADKVRGVLTYVASPQLNFSLIGGHEANNYLTVDKQGKAFGGAGMQWAPSERTRLTVEGEGRQYGSLHSINFEHRTARTSWRFSDVTDVSATPGVAGTASLGAVYDLLYNQLASTEPDPVKRAELVNAFLQANGINPNAVVTSGFLSSSLSKRRSQNLSFALIGLRDTVTFVATRGTTQRLDSLTTVVDDLSSSDVVRNNGLSVTYAHRLTPLSSLNLIASQLRTSGSVGLQSTTMRSLNLNISSRLGMHTTATLGARRVLFDGGTALPYAETAVVGNLSLQF